MINVSELDKNIKKLVQYGINSGLIPESERNYSTNMILDALAKMITLILIFQVRRLILTIY